MSGLSGTENRRFISIIPKFAPFQTYWRAVRKQVCYLLSNLVTRSWLWQNPQKMREGEVTLTVNALQHVQNWWHTETVKVPFCQGVTGKWTICVYSSICQKNSPLKHHLIEEFPNSDLVQWVCLSPTAWAWEGKLVGMQILHSLLLCVQITEIRIWSLNMHNQV